MSNTGRKMESSPGGSELPPYSYVPGKFPHPTTSPRGHSYGHLEPRDSPPLDPLQWRECPAYLRGIELFNHGYYWEAHESWEQIWLEAGRQGEVADFLKGLIKLAAALVKGREGRPEGVRRHGARAAELFALARQRGKERYLGLPVEYLETLCHQLSDHPSRYVNDSPLPVVKLLDERLVPG